MRQDLAGTTGPEATAAVTVGQSLVAVHNWTFLFGPKLALGVNTVLLAYLMYRSRLVPRAIAVLGLVGGSLIFASGTAVLFGCTKTCRSPVSRRPRRFWPGSSAWPSG